MKRSIKWKITLTFVFVIVCCIGSILLFNALFLERLYINRKKNVLKQTYQVIDAGISESRKNGYDLSDLFKKSSSNKLNRTENNFIAFLRELQENYNVNIVFMDENNKVYSLFQNNNHFDRRIMNYIFKDGANDRGLTILEKNDKYTIAINDNKGIVANLPSTEDRGPSDYYENQGPSAKDTRTPQKRASIFAHPSRNADIECFGFLSDNVTAFFLVSSVGSIKEAISLFNRILILVSIIILIIGSAAIFVITNNLVKPITRLTEISKKMSNLEFEHKYKGNNDDEIGVLGNSMNEMSDKLEKAVKELKNANVKLRQDLEEKEQLDLMRQEFVANVSHELKTPIALIEGYAEGLMTPGVADKPESREYYVNVITDETKRMDSMVHSLLDLSALERGMAELNIERINLFDVIKGMVNSLEVKFSDKGVKPAIEVSKDVFVWADGFKLEEVIRNYLTNAINHVDDKKVIKIYTENVEKDKIRFAVYNTGVKLTKEQSERVWEKFYKVDKARTREYGGTGLGLSIVKAIAMQHNTTCGCEVKDDGMIFYFDFSIK